MQYYNAANGHIAINNITGEFSAGQTIHGVESGFTMTLQSFTQRDEMAEFTYDQTNWVVSDTGVVAIDDHFTGNPSQEYQDDHIVVE